MARIKSIAESDLITILGSAARNLYQAIKFILKGKIDYPQLRAQMVNIGFDCMLMVLALTAIGSMILSINTASELTKFGGRQVVGGLIAISDLREILPVLAAFAIGARTGTAMTAEIATMKVTEQIDALKLMKTDPIYYILAPRLLAGILLSPFIIAIAAFVSIIAGMVVCNLNTGLESVEFLESAWQSITIKEYSYPTLKMLIFTTYAILMNVTMGLGTSGGAKEVGISTTKATAFVMIGIIILDGILTALLYN